MSNREEILTPVGRLVMGSLYDPQTTDAENRPLVYKTGVNAGQPRVEYFFALAIAKGNESHWNETEWGAKIWSVGEKGFPNGQTKHPSFAWKITDGDSDIPNKAGRKPCDRDGYPGHWVLHFSGGFAPNIYNANGTEQLLDKGVVNPGDYIQVYGSVKDNESTQTPGIYLNHSMVAFAGYGERIVTGKDPKEVGFGQAPLPAGVSKTPVAGGFNPGQPPAPAPAAQAPAPQASAPAPSPVTTPPPHPGILPPPTAPVAKKMTEKANGIPYEDYVAQGWTDELLVQHGYMVT